MSDKLPWIGMACGFLIACLLGGLYLAAKPYKTQYDQLQEKYDSATREWQERLLKQQAELGELRNQSNNATSLESKVGGLEADLQRITKERDAWQSNLDAANQATQTEHAKLASLQQELEHAANQAKEYEQELTAAKTYRTDLENGAAGGSRAEIDELNREIAQLEMVGARQASQIRDLTYAMDDLKRKAVSAVPSSQPAPITETKQPDQPVAPKPTEETHTFTNPADTPDISGKIITMDSDFVVVDIGAEKGVGEAWYLYVFRNGESVGILQVKKTYPSMATTSILRETFKGAPQAGDDIRTVNLPPVPATTDK